MIKTTPVFYYDFRITPENLFISFDDGFGEVNARLTPRNYSPQALAIEVARSMSDAGDQDYTCTFDRDLRLFTISAPLPFDLLVSSSSVMGMSAFSVLGFTGSDLTGDDTYQGNIQAGKEFIPQFPPQEFIGFDDFKELNEPKINESASGVVEVYSLGERSFMEFNLTFATNEPQGKNGIIRSDPTGIEKLRDFMRYCITRGDLDFMQDATDRSDYSTIRLESTPQSSTGTGYRLSELYARGLAGYFETGNLKWRLRDGN